MSETNDEFSARQVRKVLNVIVAVVVLLIGVGVASYVWTPADRARIGMSSTTITMYGLDGHVIGKWETDGRPKSEGTSDGWYFKDANTGKAMIISGGAVVIEGHGS